MNISGDVSSYITLVQTVDNQLKHSGELSRMQGLWRNVCAI